MKGRYLAVLAATALALLSGVVLSACGDDDAEDSSDAAMASEATDGAFIVEMSDHHNSAIEMAEMASERAEHPEVQQLAQNIIASQGGEIEQMDEIHQRLFDAPTGGAEHGTLGLSESAMGMDHDTAMLESAKPFDREFIDMMIPHHQGAIRMARLELADGEDDELTALASAIIEAQSTEIDQMNTWRMKWYGAESPAGGVPAEDEGSDMGATEPEEGSEGGSMEGMEH